MERYLIDKKVSGDFLRNECFKEGEENAVEEALPSHSIKALIIKILIRRSFLLTR